MQRLFIRHAWRTMGARAPPLLPIRTISTKSRIGPVQGTSRGVTKSAAFRAREAADKAKSENNTQSAPSTNEDSPDASTSAENTKADDATLDATKVASEPPRNADRVKEYASTTQFNTDDAVRRLLDVGIGRPEAEAFVDVLRVIMEGVGSDMSTRLVTRAERSRITSLQLHELTQVMTDAEVSMRNQVSNLRREVEQQMSDVTHLRRRLHDELARVRANTRLMYNLEKGRSRQELHNRTAKLGDAEVDFRQTVNNLEGMIQNTKLNISQISVGVFTATLAVLMGFFRLIY